MKLTDRLILLAATGGGIGKMPYAPGTFGTLVGILFALPLLVLPGVFTGLYLICLILGGIYAADRAEDLLEQKDPGCIVIDEIAGYVVAVSSLPLQVSTLAAGFLMFRIFDIWKPAPVRYFETHFSGGAAVMLDDIMAGVLAAAGLWILHLPGLI